MNKLIIAIAILLPTLTFAQQDDISPERKRAIDSLAMEKVKDLSKYISIIGSKETPFSEASRVIDRALELFSDGAQMGVSSLNRKEIQYYGVKKYFERLMALSDLLFKQLLPLGARDYIDVQSFMWVIAKY